MMDISDGIGSDLRHILEASHVGAEIDCSALPLSKEMQICARRHHWDVEALSIDGGEDYELLFTMAPAAVSALTLPCHVIGRIVEGGGIHWLHSATDKHDGFRHF